MDAGSVQLTSNGTLVPVPKASPSLTQDSLPPSSLDATMQSSNVVDTYPDQKKGQPQSNCSKQSNRGKSEISLPRAIRSSSQRHFIRPYSCGMAIYGSQTCMYILKIRIKPPKFQTTAGALNACRLRSKLCQCQQLDGRGLK